MPEYIERSAIMRRIEQEAFRWGEEYDLQQILGDIADAPAADVVEVVRCKDCKFKERASSVKYGLPVCRLLICEVAYDFYCAKGAKMDGKGEE